MKMLRMFYSLPVSLTGSVVDIETDNNRHITVLGWIGSNTLGQLIREVKDDNEEFYKECKSILVSLPMPYYAYYAPFEEELLAPLKFIELMKQNRTPKRDALYYLWHTDPYYGHGERCLEDYTKYKDEHDINALQRIIRHNKWCLLQELSLVILNRGVGM
jgi:hypothetical protein